MWAAEEPITIEVADLPTRFAAGAVTPEVVARVVDLGPVKLTDDGRLRVMSPRFLEIGTHLGALGVPTDEIAASLEQLGHLARAVVDLTLAHSIQRRAQQFLDDQAASLAASVPTRHRSAQATKTSPPMKKSTARPSGSKQAAAHPVPRSRRPSR